MEATIHLGNDFRTEITKVRKKFTEETNFSKWGNTFYRVCRDGEGLATLNVVHSSGDNGKTLKCRVRLEDLYFEQVGDLNIKATPTYPSTLRRREPEVGILDAAILALLPGSEEGKNKKDKRLDLCFVLVFCIAESLRNDEVATKVHLALKSHLVGIVGMENPSIPIPDLWPDVHNWKNTSDAVFAAMSDQARSIALRRRSELSPQERQFSERIREGAIDDKHRGTARRVSVLKRPSK